jgi:hypothetical protein
MLPAHRPFRREDHVANDWTAIPRVLRNVLILFVRSAQEKCISGESIPTTELCRYRGQSLVDLKCSLSEAAGDPYGIILAGIITLMGIELQNPIFGTWVWLYHFNAARSIIQLRGGIGKCFFDLPHLQMLLLKYMLLDVMSATTSNTSALAVDSVHKQTRYIPILLLREKCLVENGHLCPQQILKAIINTTILRVQSQKASVDREDSQGLSSFEEVHHDITNFDSLSWARRVSCYGLMQPSMLDQYPSQAVAEAWNQLGLSFKYAALLYLLLSTRAPTSQWERKEISLVQRSLAHSIHKLFIIGSADPNGPLETQLWKFALWPAFISTYAYICWCCHNRRALELELQRVRNTAAILGASSWLKTIEYLNGIAERRAAVFGAEWRWNDGFSARCVFVGS